MLSSFIKEENVLSQNCLPSQTSQLLLARIELPVRPWVQGGWERECILAFVALGAKGKI